MIKGKGRDTGGKGNADALITAQLHAVDPKTTKVEVHTDLNISGKVAQFGRGAMADISNKLLGQFVDNLETTVLSQPSPVAPVAEVVSHAVPESVTEPVLAEAAASEPGAAEPGAAESAATSITHETRSEPVPAVASAAPSVRKIEPVKPVEALDLMGVARGAMLKRLAPLGVVVAAVLIWLSRR